MQKDSEVSGLADGRDRGDTFGYFGIEEGNIGQDNLPIVVNTGSSIFIGYSHVEHDGITLDICGKLIDRAGLIERESLKGPWLVW